MNNYWTLAYLTSSVILITIYRRTCLCSQLIWKSSFSYHYDHSSIHIYIYCYSQKEKMPWPSNIWCKSGRYDHRHRTSVIVSQWCHAEGWSWLTSPDPLVYTVLSVSGQWLRKSILKYWISNNNWHHLI